MAIKAFADTNIIIDFIENRDFDRLSVNKFFLAAEEGDPDIYVSESVITNSLYITGLDKQISLLLKIVKTCCFRIETLQMAMAGNYKDKEDAILYFGALQNKMDFFITRNKKDFLPFATPALPIVSPKELLLLLA